MTLNDFPCIEGNTITSETTTDNSLRYFILSDSLSYGHDAREYTGLTFSDYLSENEQTYMSISGEISDYNYYTSTTQKISMTVTDSSNDYLVCYSGTVTISNFTSSTSCIKHVYLVTSSISLSLGSSWTLAYEGTHIIARSILILDWNGSSGTVNIAVPTWDYYSNPYFEFTLYQDCSEVLCLSSSTYQINYILYPVAILINGVLSDQTFTSLTASAGDTITYCMYDPDNSHDFPRISFSCAKYDRPIVYKILSPLPRTMVDATLSSTFYEQPRITYDSIPEDLYKYFTTDYRTNDDGDVDTIELESVYEGCVRLTKFPAEALDDVVATSAYCMFYEAGITTVLEGQFAGMDRLTTIQWAYTFCPVTTIGSSLFPEESLVRGMKYLFGRNDMTSSSVTAGDIFANSSYVGSGSSYVSVYGMFFGIYLTSYYYDSLGDYMSGMDDPCLDAYSLFENCTKMTAIHRDFLAYTGVFDVSYCIYYCTSLKYSYYGGSTSSSRQLYFNECPDITDCDYFAYTSKTFKVYLIKGSTSYTTFKNTSTCGVNYTTL